MSTRETKQELEKMFNIIAGSKVLYPYFLEVIPKIIDNGYIPSKEELDGVRKNYIREQGGTI